MLRVVPVDLRLARAWSNRARCTPPRSAPPPASAGASSAYLTISETFPVEIRAEAIAVFFAIAQVCGAVGPVLFGALIGNGKDAFRLSIGYLIDGGIMVISGIVDLLPGSPPRAGNWNRSPAR